jgi:hypothetical protein
VSPKIVFTTWTGAHHKEGKVKKRGLFTSVVLLTTAVSVSLLHAQNENNKLQSWYTLWSVGWTHVSYPQSIDDQIELIKALPGYSHQLLAFDVLGFYKPVIDERTILGGIINGTIDRHAVDNQSLVIGELQLSASAIRFVQNRIGQGFFLRLDLGLAHNLTDGDNRDRMTDWGLGTLVGAGFGLPVTSGIRLMLSGLYASHWYRWNEPNQSWQVTIGGLF